MKTTLEIIETAAAGQKPVLAFSGGSDSLVLLDILYQRTEHRPPLLFADSRMEYPETLPFVRKIAKKYGAELLVAQASRSPQEQWERHGWPMLGKMAARTWMKKNKGRGFRLDVSSCCRAMKIAPARKLMVAKGYTVQFTGQRGGEDDALRGLRALKDGAIYEVKADRIRIANPLIGWTDMMVRRYISQNRLPQHPAKKRGAVTIGCMYCGGGAQFTNSGFKVLRKTNPEEWRRLMVEWRAGEIVLAIKYDTTLETMRMAIERLGGLEALARERPWVFDFLYKTPLQGYDK